MSNLEASFLEPKTKQEIKRDAKRLAKIAQLMGMGAVGSAEFDFVSPNGEQHHSDFAPDAAYIQRMHPNVDFSHPDVHVAFVADTDTTPAIDPFRT